MNQESLSKQTGPPLFFQLIRERVKVDSMRTTNLEGVGYLRVTQLLESTPNKLNKAIRELQAQGIRALILDLRNNPGGLLTVSVDVAEQFLERGKLIVYLKNREDRKDEALSRSKHPFLLPLVILVNHKTEAGAEIIAGALQDWGRAKIIGIPTGGRGTVQTIVPLVDGSVLRLTTSRFFTPKGHSVEEAKIQPDILVEDRQDTAAWMSSALAELNSTLK